MKYEGKLYGKIAGKYIEVTDHVSNEVLVQKLERMISDRNERVTEFSKDDMEVSAMTSNAMAHAHRVVINIINGEK